MCNVCYGGTTNKSKSVLDCFGGCGKVTKDDCGVCQIIKKLDQTKYKDCAGVCRNKGGTAVRKCGHCVGGKKIGF